jgi:hypothetical protein
MVHLTAETLPNWFHRVAPGSRLSLRSGEDALTALGRDTKFFVSRTSEPGSPGERRSGTQGPHAQLCLHMRLPCPRRGRMVSHSRAHPT